MEHISLYRRFRPDTFDKVIGQDHVVKTLTNQIKNDSVGHAYLFTGTRGTGKTSCAKIFARAVNCEHPINGSPCGECETCKLLKEGGMDILEIDAASNNGVDEIRELKENAQYRPTFGRYKVYIIDEVHMLSTAAFNALLKTLEEPPEHIIFILATTEVQKLPPTILSRCMRFDFRLVAKDKLIGLLERIFNELGVEADKRALGLIAAGGEGCVRDTLSLADMCMSYCGNKITYEDVEEITCATNFSTLDELASAILDGDCGRALRLTDGLLNSGRNTVAKDLAGYYMDMLNLKNVPGAIPDGLTEEEAEKITARLDDYSNYRIARIMDIMCSIENSVRYTSQPKVLIEAAVVRACELVTELNLDGLTNRVKDLERKISDLEKNGVAVKTAPVKEEAPVVAEQPEQEPAPEPVEAPKKKDLNELLSEVADEQVEVVFEDDSDLVKADSFLAADIWSKVVLRLDESNEMMLRMAVSNVDRGFSIKGDSYILEYDDNATVQLLNRDEYHKIMQDLIRSVSGTDYIFVCQKPVVKEKVSAEDRVTLDQLFNGAMKIKKK